MTAIPRPGESACAERRLPLGRDGAHELEEGETDRPLELRVALDPHVGLLPTLAPRGAVLVQEALEAGVLCRQERLDRSFGLRHGLRVGDVGAEPLEHARRRPRTDGLVRGRGDAAVGRAYLQPGAPALRPAVDMVPTLGAEQGFSAQRPSSLRPQHDRPGARGGGEANRPYRRCTGASADRTRLLEQQACPEVEHPLERLGGIELARQVRPARPFEQVALRPLAVVDPGNEDARARRPVGEERSAARSDPAVREREQRLVCAFERRVEAVDGERPLGIRR